jgi:hypothetical protein
MHGLAVIDERRPTEEFAGILLRAQLVLSLSRFVHAFEEGRDRLLEREVGWLPTCEEPHPLSLTGCRCAGCGYETPWPLASCWRCAGTQARAAA